jgi:hypothetical protein
MRSRFRPKFTYANVIASLALFIALGGAAVAAGLPRHSVGAAQLKRGAVTAAAIRGKAVNGNKLAPHSVTISKLGINSVGPSNIGNGAVTSAKIASQAVLASAIKNGVVVNNKLGNEAVNAAKLAKGSVTLTKLGPEIAPLLGTLRSGQTLRGSFDIGGETMTTREGVSFQFPLTNPPSAPEANILAPGTTSPACPGLAGGNQQTPEAAAGQLCVYIRTTGGEEPKLSFSTGGVNRLGFGLLAGFKEAKPENEIQGFWAVTAP